MDCADNERVFPFPSNGKTLADKRTQSFPKPGIKFPFPSNGKTLADVYKDIGACPNAAMFPFPSNGKTLADAYSVGRSWADSKAFPFPSNGKTLADHRPRRVLM